MWYFLSQKVDGKMIFTDYWEVLVLNFWVIWNMVFFESRGWWKRWYLPITEKFLFLSFQWLELQSFFDSRSWWIRWYLLVTENLLFWTFRWWEIRSFFQPTSWLKDDVYLVFFSFPWYSRTYEILFFVQCIFTYHYQILDLRHENINHNIFHNGFQTSSSKSRFIITSGGPFIKVMTFPKKIMTVIIKIYNPGKNNWDTLYFSCGIASYSKSSISDF